MKAYTRYSLTLALTLLLSPVASTFAQPAWQTVDAITPWQGRAIVADKAGNFVSLAISTNATPGPVSTTVSLSSDAGLSWQTVGSIPGYALKLTVTPDGTLFASGNRSASVSGKAFVWWSADHGSTWTVSDPWAGKTGQFLVIDLASGNSGAIYATGYIFGGGTVLVLKGQPAPGGSITWTTLNSVGGAQPQSICVRPGAAGQPDEILVCGSMGNSWTVRRSSDGGATWVTVDSSTRGNAYGVAAGPNADLYVIGTSTQSIIITNQTTNIVHHKEVVVTNYTTQAQSVWLVRKTANDGATWADVDSVINGMPAFGSSLMVDAFGRVFAVGFTSTASQTWLVRGSTDGGVTWTTTDVFLPAGYSNSQAYCATGDALGNICVVGVLLDPGGANSAIAPIRRLAAH